MFNHPISNMKIPFKKFLKTHRAADGSLAHFIKPTEAQTASLAFGRTPRQRKRLFENGEREDRSFLATSGCSKTKVSARVRRGNLSTEAV